MKKMISKNNSHYLVKLLSLMMFFSAQHVFAQKNLPSEEVTINKDYRPLLADAVKISLHAEPAGLDTTMDVLQYDTKPHVIDVPFVPTEIKPVALSDKKDVPGQNNFVKAGFGTQLTPLLEIYLGNGKNEKFSYGLNLEHLSSNGSKIDFQDQSHNGGSLFGTSYFKNTALSARLDYDRDVYHFYGFDSTFNDTANFFTKDLLKQQFNMFGITTSFQNTKDTKANIDYRFGFSFHSFTDHPTNFFQTASDESYFNGDFNFGKQIQKVHSVHLDFSYQRLDFRSVNDTTLSYFSILPNYQYQNKALFVKAGANVSIVNGDVFLFPEGEVSYKLLDDYLIAYAGVHGSNTPATLASLSEINPFVAGYTVATTKTLAGYAGIRGAYGSNIIYNGSVGYSFNQNLPFFLPVGDNPTYFIDTFYFDAKIFGVKGEIGFKQSERLNLLLAGEANAYLLDGEDQPWGIPKSKLTFTANYNIQNKIILNADLFVNSGAYTIIPGDTVSTQLKGFADVNFSATYNYKKNIALWLSFNNIAAMKQRAWYNYPYYGFRFMAGVMLKF